MPNVHTNTINIRDNITLKAIKVKEEQKVKLELKVKNKVGSNCS